jgi:hypothetical protein
VRGPTFLILGAPKCGTSTLHALLSRHPDVFMAPSKDPLFFELDEEYRLGPGAYWERHFADWRGEPAIGEARPTKLMLPYVPARVAECYPDARLIAILRDPAERVFSHWWMRRCNGLERRGLDEALARNAAAIDAGRTFAGEGGPAEWRRHLDDPANTDPVYLEFGSYTPQIERWRAHFARERIRVVLFDDLRRDAAAVLEDLYAFVGVDPATPAAGRTVYNAAPSRLARWTHEVDRRLGLSRLVPSGARRAVADFFDGRGASPHMDPEHRRWLVSHYEPEIGALETLIGRDLSAWRSVESLPSAGVDRTIIRLPSPPHR